MAVFLLCPHMSENQERRSKLSCASIYKGTYPIMRAPPIWLNNFPKAPSQNTFTSRGSVSTHKFGGHTNILSIGNKNGIFISICLSCDFLSVGFKLEVWHLGTGVDMVERVRDKQMVYWVLPLTSLHGTNPTFFVHLHPRLPQSSPIVATPFPA